MVTFDFLDELAKEFVGCKIIDGQKREWCLNGRAIAWQRPLSKRDLALLGDRAPKGEVLAVHMPDLITRDAWVQTVPEACFVSHHFRDYPAVLIDMQKADQQLVREVFDDGVAAAKAAHL